MSPPPAPLGMGTTTLITKVHSEKVSGARAGRAELRGVIDRPEPGDVLLVTR
jgi:hypothetical protein